MYIGLYRYIFKYHGASGNEDTSCYIRRNYKRCMLGVCVWSVVACLHNLTKSWRVTIFFSFTILIFNATLTNMGGYGVLCHILYWRDDIKNLSRQICWNTFSIPGTNLENRSVASSPPGNLGGWLTDKPLLSPSCCQITDRPCTWGMGCQHQLPWDMAWWCCWGNAGENRLFFIMWVYCIQRKLGSNTSVLRTNRILRLEMMQGGRSHNNT